jgi:large subunit ribosomal protein L4
VVVVQALELDGIKTSTVARMLRQLGHARKSLVIDVHPGDNFVLSTRNIAGVQVVPANRVTARDVMDSTTIITSQAALERLQEALG